MSPHPRPELLPDETVKLPGRHAVHTDHGRKASGELLATDRRLIFRTSWVNSWFFSSVAVDLSAIESVSVASRTGNPYDGGLARRVQVRMKDGTDHLFVLGLTGGGADEYARSLEGLVNQAVDTTK